jgi:hypothetical protein
VQIESIDASWFCRLAKEMKVVMLSPVELAALNNKALGGLFAF